MAWMYGYSNQMISPAEMQGKKTWQLLHPEMRRRATALFTAAEQAHVPLGVGTGWRIQPPAGTRKGFAAPGNSYHESFPAGSNQPNALAIDTVPASSWNWMEGNLARFGLRSFRAVNNEPWHIQPAEIPAGRNRATTVPKQLRVAAIGGMAALGVPVGPDPFIPKPPLQQGSSGPGVMLLQAQLAVYKWYAGPKDSQYGPATVAAVKKMQAALKIPQSGSYDAATDRAYRAFCAAVAKL